MLTRNGWIVVIVLIWLFCGVYALGYTYGQRYALRKIKQITTYLKDNTNREFMRDMDKAGFEVKGIGSKGERIWRSK